ncbi:uncharacterized protein LOC114972539 isoform X1 [Acropora millepora]|uniref:uncharacterized protein LOC114972539 isoform X1 n=1 Tax=Acropora millepora TaxID=45264 RepID=UPI0010FC8A52|nr:uncharacterized protein LOC114972539 isoform X1 [Acropora millepora]
MEVSAAVTRQGYTLMSIQHAFTSNNCQENKDGLKSLSNALRKLQSDVNSCLTEILQEITDSQQQASQGRRQDSSEDEDGDGSDDDTANGFGTSLEPQAKKVRK